MPYVRFADTNGSLIGVYSPSCGTNVNALQSNERTYDIDDDHCLTEETAIEHQRDMSVLLSNVEALELNSLLIGERGLFVVDRRPEQEYSSCKVDWLVNAINGARRAYSLQSPLNVYLPRMYMGIFDEAEAQTKLLRDLNNATIISV